MKSIMTKFKSNRKTFILFILLFLMASLIAGCVEKNDTEKEHTKQERSVEPPKTAFEESDGEDWTTHKEELDFLNTIASESERVSYSMIGSSVEGRPLNLVKVGFPEPPSEDEIEDGRNILIMGTHHGNEPAGREMALKLLRDLAFSDDQETIDHLSRVTILFIPTINPDGREANKRFSAEDVDLNRDHLNLKTPEIQAVDRMLSKYHPDIVIDAHERTGSKTDLMTLWPENLNVDESLRTINKKMIKDYLWPDVKKAGFTTGLYSSPTSKVSGGERVETNMAALRHSLILLTESSRAREPKERVKAQMVAAQSTLRFHREQLEDVAKVVIDAPKKKAAIGANRSEPFYLDGGTNRDIIKSAVLDPPPCGYLINTEQADELSQQIELFSLETQKVSKNGVFITMNQPMMTVIPLLIDKKAKYNEVNGKRLDNCSNPGSVKPPETPENKQYKTDFSKSIKGKQPSNWSVLWQDGGFWQVKKKDSVLKHVVSEEEQGRQALTWDKMGEVSGDVEISSVVRAQNAGETKFQLGFHMLGTDVGSSQSAYFMEVFNAGNSSSASSKIQIKRTLNGHDTLLGSMELPFKVKRNTWYQTIVKREDNKIRAKVWPYAEEEPESWQIEVNDRFINHGKIGVFQFTQEAINEWAFIGVGTGKKRAPRAPDDLLKSK